MGKSESFRKKNHNKNVYKLKIAQTVYGVNSSIHACEFRVRINNSPALNLKYTFRETVEDKKDRNLTLYMRMTVRNCIR